MKNRVLRAILALVMTACFGGNVIAADQTVSVSATASIQGVTAMSITPASIVFGNTAADAYPTTPADQKVTITYSSNYNPWKLAIYTDNTAVPTVANPAEPKANERFAKGGLASIPVDHDQNPGTPAISTALVACKWFVKNPASATAVPAATVLSAYNFVKDKRDQDDPATAAQNESWATAFADGYPNIAFGSAAGGVCIDPTDVLETVGDGDGKYAGDEISGSIAVYIAGLFGTGGMVEPSPASAGEYSSSIYFDLYHE